MWRHSLAIGSKLSEVWLVDWCTNGLQVSLSFLLVEVLETFATLYSYSCGVALRWLLEVQTLVAVLFLDLLGLELTSSN